MSDFHLAAVVSEELGGHKFKDRKTVVTRFSIKRTGRMFFNTK